MFGTLFPVGSVVAEATVLDRSGIDSVSEVFLSSPAHVVVWMAPLVLAVTFWSARVRNDQLRRQRDRAERAERQLRHLVRHDSLTGLRNRRCLNDDAGALQPSTAHLLLLDLDGFKSVNDVHGHHVGDELLVAVSARLESASAPLGSVYRLGGDEFVIVVCGATQADALGLAHRLLGRLAEPVVVDGVALLTGCSIGVSCSEDLASRAGCHDAPGGRRPLPCQSRGRYGVRGVGVRCRTSADRSDVGGGIVRRGVARPLSRPGPTWWDRVPLRAHREPATRPHGCGLPRAEHYRCRS